MDIYKNYFFNFQNLLVSMTKNVQEMPQYPRNTQPNLFALSMVTLTPKYLGNAKTTKLFQEMLKKVGLAHKAKKKYLGTKYYYLVY